MDAAHAAKTITVSGAAVSSTGPTLPSVRNALRRAGFTASVSKRGKLPTVGFRVAKTDGSPFVLVTTTSFEKRGTLARYSAALTRAGFVVAPGERYPDSELAVYRPAQ